MTVHVLAMALLGAAAAQSQYYTFEQFNTNDDSCESAASSATTTIWAYGTCSRTKDGKESTKILTDDNNVTITTYPNTGCNGTGVVSFSAPLNTCSKYDGQGGKFTASQSYAAGCSNLKAPYEVTYADKSCTGMPVKVTAQTAACFDTGGDGGASSLQRCDNGTAQQCFYDKDDCEGEPSACDPLNPGVPTNTCSDYKQIVCPAAGVPFCPATTTTKSNKIVSTPIGGIVAAVILIPLIIIGVAVVIFVILRRNKASDADSSIMGGGSTTYGSA
jgi:hypothetical protein